MNTKNTIIGGIATLALVLSFIGLAHQPPAPVADQAPSHQNLGSITGPDINSLYLSVNGVRTEFVNEGLNTASSTICSVLAPTATSTLVRFILNVTTGTSTASTVDVGIGSNTTSTTTGSFVSAYSIGSGAQGAISIIGSGTSTQYIIPPSTSAAPVYINAKTVTGGLGGYTYGGSCKAVFTIL